MFNEENSKYAWRQYYAEVDGLSPYDFETQLEYEHELNKRREEMTERAWDDFVNSEAWQQFKNMIF